MAQSNHPIAATDLDATWRLERQVAFLQVLPKVPAFRVA